MKEELHNWQQMDSDHFLHPFTDHNDLSKKGTRVITKGDGIYIWDSEGNKILDGMSGLWCVSLGYGNNELIEAAYNQMKELPYYNSFFQCAHPPAIELSQKISSIAPESLNHVFFTGSGSEANDTMVRMARRYWQLQGKPEKQIIIARNNAYHGSTVAGASLGGMTGMHEQGGLPIPNIQHISQPYWFEEGGDLDQDSFGLKVARDLEQAIVEYGIDNIAAFIAEPIQGAGGVIIPPETYWPEIQRICDDYEILLVADEVITGFGRMGDWFATETYNIKPDFIPFAKGVTSGYLPLGGLLVSDRVADIIISKGGEFTHGFTYSGHPAACAVAIATINFIERENVLETVKHQTAPYLKEQWESLSTHELVGEARIKGMVAAIELTKEHRTRYASTIAAGSVCRDLAIDHGLVMRAVGDTMIIAPPLIITEQQIDELIDKTRNTLDATLKMIKSL
ncbi:MAG: aspartate aminotransferase family protein [Gammaproteobacteria bacterium]|jgi:putrescine aminotransferase|nr:aspartate aminotransferase family protein [Gammaproteobacteria bacterium]MBT5216627.1 aspartate aminotransferase family protein [Gammaproteobacteria bacterium]MBT5541290.1 aspartate aminotransferase family protein [Gammaproteobacteria bacterium]MBT6074792.1 aspartate aminotransferase family protein [Gammaproteobacteria bacterium]MBT7752966.1 aspartate aminotransferase family protein [Gammaproteobacteria bacterium]